MKTKYINFIIVLCVIYIIVIAYQTKSYTSCKNEAVVVVDKEEKNGVKIADLKIKNRVIAIVFYGRKRQVQILYEYLIRNLKANGGVLDKVIFCVKAWRKDDLEYLEKLMKQNPRHFERVYSKNNTFTEFYNVLKDDDLVFKIDDDIVFIQNGTFERMLEEYVTKNATILSANVINHTILSHVHARLRAILPFYEHKNYSWVLDTQSPEMSPLTTGMHYHVYSNWFYKGELAAIAHESFLHHIYNNDIDSVYNFGRWNFHSVRFERWSINFLLFRGKYVNKMTNLDDEKEISMFIPQRMNRYAYALGSAIVSHFSYRVQIEYLQYTNILDKYEKLAKDYFSVL